MAKPRSQRIAIVLQLLTRKEQQAASEFENYRIRLDSEHRQLHQLQEYRRDYVASTASIRGAVDLSQLARYRTFMQQLSDTVDAQQAKLQNMEQTLQQLKDIWVGFYRRRQTMADLIARYQQEEEQLLDKLLQKELDDLSANRKDFYDAG